jgi:TfoX/Sxy family transcriptional regulator of competence genes
MAYDETAATRIRAALKNRKGITERKMFGGLAFLLRGNMCCGLLGSDLMLRLGPERAAQALREPYVRAMDFTGKPMKSMVFVAPAGYETDTELRHWLDLATAFAGKLPAKENPAVRRAKSAKQKNGRRAIDSK